ncbi:MAG: ABC transporter, permease protein [Candidatus Carbobacillus altaicus]|uniref:ABC transporter, permease protein n=1 Tax=Candidatus Carbonibacillus altaicus TaxID=2163959 RepID=A0A2R6XZ37_9BACL|nr:MAG: ABC transporter, permease protein [Candidatus Carbobacillus altaicus]
MISELFGSMNQLFVKSAAPHYVQMHSGMINKAKIDLWASQSGLVRQNQTVEMVPVEGGTIYFADSDTSEKTSVMQFYFVRQNERFDFLLNLENEKVDVAEGEIAVPVFFMQQKHLSVGDKLRVVLPAFTKEFTISDFVRDVQMNPSLVHSKRFVVHPADYAMLKENVGAVEYLIEFQLKDPGRLGEFNKLYQSSDLPKTGPTIDLNLFKTLNALTDGVVAAVIILVSLLLILIATLVIRFTLLATLEEDYHEIGVLKAIGASRRDVRMLYLMKYVVLAALASACGYVVSFFVYGLVSVNVSLYFGKADNSIFHAIIPMIAVAFIFALVLLFCMLVLRKFNQVTAVDALRSGSIGETTVSRNRWRLHQNRFLPIPIFLGLKNVFQRHKMFGLLLFVFIASSFILIVPLHFLNTIQSPGFISYLGIGRSDIRIDLQHSDQMLDRYRQLIDAIRQDGDVERYSPLVTSRFKMINEDGTVDNLNIETGDFSIFPLKYVQGGAPRRENEIALSYLNAKEMGKRVGDSLRLLVDGEEKIMVVSGIYQDVTNGGRTAKAMLPFNPNSVLWYVVSLNVKPHVDLREKIEQYEKAFYPAKVTDLQGYLHQTLGNTIDQLRRILILTFFVAIFLSILITALFLKMLVAKDRQQIAIMRSIGFAPREIRTQYVTMALFVLTIGILLGTIFSNTLGQMLVSAVWSFLGASQIDFVIDPIQAYVICPLILILVVTVTAWLSTGKARQVSIAEMIKE